MIRLQAMGITVHTIVGNHTAYYKDTNEINTVDLLLKQYDNVVVYSEPTEINIGGLEYFITSLDKRRESLTNYGDD